MNLTRKKTHKSKVIQGVTLLFAMIFTVLSMMTAPLAGYAIGDIDAFEQDVDLKAYTFDELCSKKVKFYGDIENMKDKGDPIANGIYYNVKSSYEYSKWLSKALVYIEHTGDANTGYLFTPQPAKTKENNWLANENRWSSEQKETEAWAQYNTYANKMTKIMARGQGQAMVGDVFGQEFDPTNAVTLAAMNTFTMVCNTIFNVVSRALMLLFLVQTGFDVLYLVIPALQPILAPANASSGGGGAGLAQGKKFAMRFNVVSNEAVEANNRGATGSVGTNGGNGGGIFQTNIALRYLMARAPLIIIAFTYFVLVATNVWTDIISACTAFITGIFYGL